MRYAPCIGLMLLLLTTSAAARQGLVEVGEHADISIHTRGVGLARLLAEFDGVAGTVSTVPPELGDYEVNVWFDALSVDQAVKRIFESVPLDYAMIGQTRIVVTGVSQPREAQRGAQPLARPAPAEVLTAPPGGVSNPFQIPGQTFGQEATGFVNPAAPGFGSPTAPGVTNPFGAVVNPQGNAPNPGFQQFPFGAPAGTQNAPPGLPVQPSVFGNTSPSILDLNPSQPQVPGQPAVNPFLPPSPAAPPQQP